MRYARDHEDESLRGQPILDDDGARQWKPCEAPAMRGQAKCVAHGGKSPQALKRAEDQLKAARDPLMAALLQVALDERKSVAERLKAITWALERTGFKGGMEVDVALKPWEQHLVEMSDLERAAFEKWRAKRGMWSGHWRDDDEDDDSPDRTIDGEWADKQPANAVQANPTYDDDASRALVAELRAAMSQRPEKYEDERTGESALHGPATPVSSSTTLPRTWQAPLKRRG